MRTRNVPEAKDEIQVIKYLDIAEMTITGSGKVSDNAFYAAKEIVLTITAKRPEILSQLSGYEFVLVAPGESVGEALGWDEKQTGRSGAALTPQGYLGFPGRFASVIEKRKKPNMETFVHEFGHAIHAVVAKIDPEFDPSLNRAYSEAMKHGLWADKYFSQDNWKQEFSPVNEYWADSVRMWYYVGAGKEFETRDMFRQYDPGLTGLFDLWLSDEDIPIGY